MRQTKKDKKRSSFVLPFWMEVIIVTWYYCLFERAYFVLFSLPIYTFIIELFVLLLRLFTIEVSLEISIVPIIIFGVFYIAFDMWLYRITSVLLSKYSNKYYDTILYKTPKFILALLFLFLFMFLIMIIYYELLL